MRVKRTRGEDEDSKGSSSKVMRDTNMAYVTFIWGCEIVHILECMFLGIELKKHNNMRRICYVAENEVPLRSILEMWWEIREFRHLEVEGRNAKRLGRLGHGYNKLLAWNVRDLEVVVLVDSNLWVKNNLDHLFVNMECCECAAVFRDDANFSRPSISSTTAENYVGGSVNSAVVALKPNAEVFNAMLNALKTFVAAHEGGGEDEFMWEFFGAERESLLPLDLKNNVEVYQLTYAPLVADPENRWKEIVAHAEEIKVVQFNIRPKPADLILGKINESTCGAVWTAMKDEAQNLNNPGIVIAPKVKKMIEKALRGDDVQKSQKAIEMCTNLFMGYCDEWYLWVWPTFVQRLASKCARLAQVYDATSNVGYICKFCGDEWSQIGCEQHVLFGCPCIANTAMEAWREYGPGTETNIVVGQNDWACIIHKMASNPYSLQHGVQVQVRIAYLATLMRKYKDMVEGLKWNTQDEVLQLYDNTCMNQCKENGAHHRRGAWFGPAPSAQMWKAWYI